MEAMTLEQIKDWHLKRAGLESSEKTAGMHARMAKALSAHLAQRAQAVDVGAAAKRLGAHLFHEHALLLPYPALCKALDISLAESPKDAFVKELLRVNDQRTRALSVQKAGPVGVPVPCNAVAKHEWEDEGQPVQSEYEPSLFSGWRRCKACGLRQHYTKAGAGEGRALSMEEAFKKRLPASPTPGKEGEG